MLINISTWPVEFHLHLQWKQVPLPFSLTTRSPPSPSLLIQIYGLEAFRWFGVWSNNCMFQWNCANHLFRRIKYWVTGLYSFSSLVFLYFFFSFSEGNHKWLIGVYLWPLRAVARNPSRSTRASHVGQAQRRIQSRRQLALRHSLGLLKNKNYMINKYFFYLNILFIRTEHPYQFFLIPHLTKLTKLNELTSRFCLISSIMIMKIRIISGISMWIERSKSDEPVRTSWII
jgi:hypothetical protein